MSKYYIFTDGVVRGPFLLENIAMMLSDGRIELATPISTGKGMPWQTIAERQEILNAEKELRTPQKKAAAEPGSRTIFYCPKCKQKYEGDSSWLGKDVVCINCNEIFSATDGSTNAAENIKNEENFVELRGTKAGAKISNIGGLEIFSESYGQLVDITPLADDMEGIPQHEANLRHFLDVLDGAKPDFVPVQGVNMIKILEAMYQSAKLGHEIKL